MFEKPLKLPLIEALPGKLFPLAAEHVGRVATPQLAEVIPLPRSEQLALDIPTNIEMGVE